MNEKAWVYLNGEYIRLKDAKISILDRGFLYGDGLFETLRAYGGRILKASRHLERLYRSASQIHLDIGIDKESLQSTLEELLNRNQLSEAILRITVSRGVSEHGIQLNPTAPTLSIFARQANPLSTEKYEQGVGILISEGTAHRLPHVDPAIKSCNFLPQILLQEKARKDEAFDLISTDPEGRICEGTTTNVFFVKDNILKTPSLSPYLLPGITRQLVLEIAERAGIQSIESEMRSEQALDADEAFLVNTGIEILPVVTINHRLIGEGSPGPLTRRLREEYLKIVEDPDLSC
ncbi:MAG: hypothetical protein G3M78_11025 [Candidatus Nitrohelix vancouverensis]|uniref:branched-chain-amino-acid transaminase n=1 Tax=Candidatus Nitrohelix vancouverensis TaxID=2705534 RepID=A0A7T0G432_9BACT|nr:MAG: hypothetical protein G3M78_11025 [Candidatus Nitrohelix vancouverensis]